MHNPEFVSTATAYMDFHEQKKIILGNESGTEKQVRLINMFYKTFYPRSIIENCTSIESESMKIFCNVFYSIKIQYFNELYFVCQRHGMEFNRVKNLMLGNRWINPMHTQVPGRDGRFSYGGNCLPKDTNALLCHMKKVGSPSSLLESCIKERN